MVFDFRGMWTKIEAVVHMSTLSTFAALSWNHSPTVGIVVVLPRDSLDLS